MSLSTLTITSQKLGSQLVKLEWHVVTLANPPTLGRPNFFASYSWGQWIFVPTIFWSWSSIHTDIVSSILFEMVREGNDCLSPNISRLGLIVFTYTYIVSSILFKMIIHRTSGHCDSQKSNSESRFKVFLTALRGYAWVSCDRPYTGFGLTWCTLFITCIMSLLYRAVSIVQYCANFPLRM